MKSHRQTIFWSGSMGEAYANRNPHSLMELNRLYKMQYGISRLAMNRKFLDDLDRSMRILEAGANIGLQLTALQKMGFSNLLGVELNAWAVRQAKQQHPRINIMQGSVFDLPFRDDYFDMVFTSGLLIHIAPRDLPRAMNEITRVTRRFIWGFEYFSPLLTSIPYRGRKNLLWKRNFSGLYKKYFPDIGMLKKESFEMRDGNVSQMFLLEKKAS